MYGVNAAINPVTGTMWLLFMGYWLVAALRAKRSVRSPANWGGMLLRATLIYGTVALFQLAPLYDAGTAFERWSGFGQRPAAVDLGIGLCGLGLALAVWARLHLADNWGVPMSLRDQHELITSGPYAVLRHPIYTGLLIALLGSAFAEGSISFALFIVFAIYFTYCAHREDRALSEKFAPRYDEYRRRTKMLVPYVL